MKFKGINHLAMVTADMEATIRFWRDLIGMRLIHGFGKDGFRHYFFEIDEKNTIAFFEWEGVQKVDKKYHGVPFEGPMAKGAPHPRSFGTFPKVLGKYVREEKVLTLEDAVRRMTGFPAQKLRFRDRGLVKKNYKADLVIFDPETIIDKADFVNPFQRPAGIEHVLVNGDYVVKSGMHTKARPGVVT